MRDSEFMEKLHAELVSSETTKEILKELSKEREEARRRNFSYRNKNKEAINTRSRIRYNKEKDRAKHFRVKYGITIEQYDELVKKQNNKCAICGTDKPNGRGTNWHVDHDHTTGKIRGLLCYICNTRLAWVENKEWMSAVNRYLEK